MNTRKTVYNKLFKEETQLAKHEVELGAAQDLEKELVVMQNLQNPISQNIDRLTNLSKQLSDEKKSANDNLLKLNSSYEKAVVLHEKLKKMQGELGINLPIVETAFNRLKGAESDFKDLRTLLNQIK
jgi:DNA repair exonuclease SbcCD ATPase subunit